MRLPVLHCLDLTFYACLVLGLYMHTLPAAAHQLPRPLPQDTRMRVVAYDPDDVVQLTAQPLVGTSVQFSPLENIVGVQSGDSAAWMITINPLVPHRVFLKPTMDASDTHLVVLTDKNTYHFQLTVTDENDSTAADTANTAKTKTADKTEKTEKTEKISPVMYNVRFTYPLAEKEALRLQELQHALAKKEKNENAHSAYWLRDTLKGVSVNTRYFFSRRCSTAFLPRQVFDDGTFTYFQFAHTAPVPAIFQVDSEGLERPVNWHVRDSYVIVEATARQFSLREGNTVTCVLNDRPPAPYTPHTP